MNFLLDTNVVSELKKPRPNPKVTAWLDDTDEDGIFLSVVTITELRYGIERMSAGKRRRRLDEWQQELEARFDQRILSVDVLIANVCGRLIARREASGRPMEARDAFIAATADVYGLTLVTRNTSDFGPSLEAILNPWI